VYLLGTGSEYPVSIVGKLQEAKDVRFFLHGDLAGNTQTVYRLHARCDPIPDV